MTNTTIDAAIIAEWDSMLPAAPRIPARRPRIALAIAFAEECSTCGAPAGQCCVSASGKPQTYPHAARA